MWDIINIKTNKGVKVITNLEGYQMVEIYNNPSVLLERRMTEV